MEAPPLGTHQGMMDPEAAALLAQLALFPPAASHLEARVNYHARCATVQPLSAPVAEVLDLAAGAVPLRLYRPTMRRSDCPALVYFHGGGWVLGDIASHDTLSRDLALASQCVVISVDYRLAPEAPFPAAVDDCVAATRYVFEHAAELGVDAGRIAVGGDSAGGNLAAVVCLALRAAAAPLPAFQLLIYPVTDMRGPVAGAASRDSYKAFATGLGLTAASMEYFSRLYMGEGDADAARADWRASPILAASLRGLPPALVLTAGCDVLRDEGRAYADALSSAGVSCSYVCFERQPHGFIKNGGVVREATAAVDMCAAALRRALGQAEKRGSG
jgi:acetyl esterase